MSDEQTYEVDFCNSTVTLSVEIGSDSVQLDATISGTATWTGVDPTHATDSGVLSIEHATLDDDLRVECEWGPWVDIASATLELAGRFPGQELGSDLCEGKGIDWTDAVDEIRCLVEELHGEV